MEEQMFIMLGKKIFNQVEPIIAKRMRKMLRPWWKRLFGIK